MSAIHITGLDTSDLYQTLKSLYNNNVNSKNNYKNITIISTDELINESFAELFDNGKDFKKFIRNDEKKTLADEMHVELVIMKRNEIIKNNPDNIIIFIGDYIERFIQNFTDEIVLSSGYYIDVPMHELYRNINKKMLQIIIKNSDELFSLYKSEFPKYIDYIVEYELGIKKFPVNYYDLVSLDDGLKQKYSDNQQYTIIPESNILTEIDTIVNKFIQENNQKNKKEGGYYKKYKKYKHKYLKQKS
ncbi:MAG: hypothetical protein Terrestrivirus13_9 [Terrestrivirus sp.]|uniref:Uncharacterized protein n=1 Tax=Terrestrivirus sp. TaxID=2487775 RepID=A0A3G4ZT15_9VIRU|nr:MAG: hypothetical protein Terrestrivirus13_9 [Terrestrivirus sp.]